jgi:hypothetical protein
MSEKIGEMILPGTYIDVRAEGLIGVGGISTGNIGVVGTADRGPVNEVRILGSYIEALDTFGVYDAWSTAAGANPLSLTRTLEQVFRGGGSTIYAVRVANGTPVTRALSVRDAGAEELFSLSATSPGTWANDITATLTPAAGGDPARLELVYRGDKETFEGTTALEIHTAVVDGSQLVVAGTLDAADAGTAPEAVAEDTPGSNDGADATTAELATGLTVLATQEVNLIVAGAFPARTAAATVLAHLESTENDGRERLAVLGVGADGVADLVANDVGAVSNKRVILVGPGIEVTDAPSGTLVDLPGPYSAALVAGRLASVAPHISLTNKDLAVGGLTTDYTRAQQKNLLQNRVLVLRKHFGFRVLKGITTDTGAFKQISVRRIVDFAKAGVRLGSNPYIGKLNNSRVRAALKATLDGFLSGMVLDEMLTGYELDVTATRAQEINGIALVTMTLRPTFSIDFVKVIMNLE